MSLSIYCGSRILRTREPLGTQKSKTIPRHFFARKLRKFSANSLIKMFLDFSKFGLSIKSWKLVSTTPPSPHQTWEFGILAKLDSASKVGNWFPPNPPPPHRTWEFGILANWTQHQKLGIGFHQPPPLPHRTWEFRILANLDSASKVVNWFPPNPLPPLDMGIWDFSKFGLSIKSWKFVSTNPPSPPPNWTWKFGILANVDSASKVGNWFPPTPSPPPTTRHGNLEF